MTIFYLCDPDGTIMSYHLANDRVNYVSENSGNVVWLVDEGRRARGLRSRPGPICQLTAPRSTASC